MGLKSFFTLFFISLSWVSCSDCFAKLKVAGIFQTEMVLQKASKVPVWGESDPDQIVKIDFINKTYKTKADKCGKWKLKMDLHNYGGPYKMKVYTDSNTISFEDIMVGEVWLCGGQSNMQWPVSKSNNAKEEIRDASHPNIRICSIDKKFLDYPANDLSTKWNRCTAETIENFSAVGYFFGRDLQKDINVPVGLIMCAWGGSTIEAWTSRQTLNSLPEFKKTMAAYSEINSTEIMKKNKSISSSALRRKLEILGHKKPFGAFNGMINPIIPYSIKGVIWYQGEANASRAYQYRSLFPALIKDWRNRWEQGDFPFLFVQLAGFKEQSAEPNDSEWAELREAQTMALKLPNTGMALAIDIGELQSIHPKNKQEVGRRLALIALEKVYGKDVKSSGPMFSKMEIDKNNINLYFDFAYKGLKSKGIKLRGFAIANKDKKFKWAEAEIKGKKVVVHSDEIKNPIAVRYDWDGYPTGNLYNSEDLPACPFRTDDFQLTTFDRYTNIFSLKE
ncbi:MAG: sialate O-acetylesterase [Phycisphaerales bacterium]